LFTIPTLTSGRCTSSSSSRKVGWELLHVTVTEHPTAAWLWRQLIGVAPWGQGPQFLLRDRDQAYGGDVVPRAKRSGLATPLTPVRAPRANEVAERVIGTLRRECLEHLIPLDEQHLHGILPMHVAR
jgi:transposase InsO family protein